MPEVKLSRLRCHQQHRAEIEAVVQVTFDWRAARDSALGRICTVTPINAFEAYCCGPAINPRS